MHSYNGQRNKGASIKIGKYSTTTIYVTPNNRRRKRQKRIETTDYNITDSGLSLE